MSCVSVVDCILHIIQSYHLTELVYVSQNIAQVVGFCAKMDWQSQGKCKKINITTPEGLAFPGLSTSKIQRLTHVYTQMVRDHYIVLVQMAVRDSLHKCTVEDAIFVIAQARKLTDDRAQFTIFRLRRTFEKVWQKSLTTICFIKFIPSYIRLCYSF